MNKLKLLIPTLSVATVATGVFTTTSCSKSDVVEIELTKILQINGQSNFHCVYTDGPMDFNKETEYVANIDMGKFDMGTKNIFNFCLSEDAPKSTWWDRNTKPIKKVDVQIDEKELTEVPIGYDKNDDSFYLVYDPENNHYGLETGIVTIKKNSKIRIEFEARESVKKLYPVLTIWYEE